MGWHVSHMVEDSYSGYRHTTETSLELVEALKAIDDGRVTELADYTEMSTSTIHDHMKTLRRKGYVTKEGDIYYVGLKFFYIGEYARNRRDIYQYMIDNLEELSVETGEEADFAVEENGRLIVLYDEDSRPTGDGFNAGKYYHLHSTAAGKSLLAKMSDDDIESIIDKWGLPEDTSSTITDESELFEELDRIRERGYGINDEESDPGLQAVATSIENSYGGVCGAITLTGPKYRFDIEAMGELLLEYTWTIEKEIIEQNIY